MHIMFSEQSHAVILSETKMLKCIQGRDGHIKPDAIRFIKRTLGMDKTGVHSLRADEEFLLRDISESSSKLEKDCFQIAFVIFVMGHVLAPTTKHDYATIDFWGALSNTETISQFNWCEYVLDCLMEAVRRVKNDMIANNPGTNLVGCHLFLQVFFLDNVDLGMFNKKHDVLPCISDFDLDSLRRMITMSTDIGKGATSHSNCKLRSAQDVCYARSKYPEHPPNNMNPQTTSGDPSASIARDPDHHNVNEHARAAFPDQVLDVQTPLRVLGPLDFTQYLRAHYPSLVCLPLMLRSCFGQFFL